MAVDISGMAYFLPIFAFLFVFIVIYVVLSKTKIIGDSKFVQLLVSFILSIVFITISSARAYLQTVIPWFVMLIIVVFIFLVMISFSQNDVQKTMKPLMWVILGILILVFVISAVNVFGPAFDRVFIPEASESYSEYRIKNFLYSSQFLGSVLLLIVAGAVAWVLTKGGKE